MPEHLWGMTSVTGNLDDTLARAIPLAVSGDQAAFARIVQAHHGDMTRVCYVICGDLDLADEAVQSAWAIAWKKLGTLKDPERLRPWLVSVAANEGRQLIRHRRRRTVVELSVSPGAEHAQAAADPAGRTADLDLANALARLDPDDRALLALRYVAGFDSSELARATGRSASGTRARLARLLDRLRTELRDD
jgi:RNA polymerase sigma factor (sigma-70 family)